MKKVLFSFFNYDNDNIESILPDYFNPFISSILLFSANSFKLTESVICRESSSSSRLLAWTQSLYRVGLSFLSKHPSLLSLSSFDFQKKPLSFLLSYPFSLIPPWSPFHSFGIYTDLKAKSLFHLPYSQSKLCSHCQKSYALNFQSFFFLVIRFKQVKGKDMDDFFLQ